MSGLFRRPWGGRSMIGSSVMGLAVMLSGCAAQTLIDAVKADQPDQITVLLKAGQDIEGRDTYN